MNRFEFRLIFVVFLLILFSFLIFIKTEKFFRGLSSREDGNFILLKEDGGVYGYLEFKKKKGKFLLSLAGKEMYLDEGKKFKIGNHLYKIILYPALKNFQTFFNRSYSDCRIYGNDRFYIGIGGNEKKVEKRLLIRFSRDVLKKIGVKNNIKIFATIYPAKKLKDKNYFLKDKFFRRGITKEFILETPYKFLSVVDRNGNPTGLIKNGKRYEFISGKKDSSGKINRFLIVNDSILSIGNEVKLKFNIQDVEWVAIKKDRNGKKRKIPMADTFLKISVEKNEKNRKKIYFAKLVSEYNGYRVSFPLSLQKKNFLVGKRALLKIITGEVIPDYVDNREIVEDFAEFIKLGGIKLENGKLKLLKKNEIKNGKLLRIYKKFQEEFLLGKIKNRLDKINSEAQPMGFFLELQVFGENFRKICEVNTSQDWEIVNVKTSLNKTYLAGKLLDTYSGIPFITLSSPISSKKYVLRKRFNLKLREKYVLNLKFLPLQPASIYLNGEKIGDFSFNYTLNDLSSRANKYLKNGENELKVEFKGKIENFPLVNVPYFSFKVVEDGKCVKDPLKTVKVYFRVGWEGEAKNNPKFEINNMDGVKLVKGVVSIGGNEIFPEREGTFKRTFIFKFPENFYGKKIKLTVNSSALLFENPYGALDGKREKILTFIPDKKRNTFKIYFLYKYYKIKPEDFFVKYLIKNKIKKLPISKNYNTLKNVKKKYVGIFFDRDRRNFHYLIAIDGNRRLLGKELVIFTKTIFWKRNSGGTFLWQNGKRKVNLNLKGNYGIIKGENSYLLKQDASPSILFGDFFVLPDFDSYLSYGGDYTPVGGRNKKLPGYIVLTPFPEGLFLERYNNFPVVINGKRVEKNKIKLKHGDILQIDDTTYLLSSENNGELAEIRVQGNRKYVSYPAGCMDFSTFGGFPKLNYSNSIFGVFSKFFEEHGDQSPSVTMTIDADLQKLVLSECEREILKIKAEDWKNYSRVRDSEKKRLLNKFYSCAFILLNDKNEILADVSIPYYNVLKGEDIKPYRMVFLNNYRKSFFINRCTELSLPPGSSFKIVVSMFILDMARRNSLARELTERFNASGGFRNIKGKVLKNGKLIKFDLKNFKNEPMYKNLIKIEDAFIHSYNAYYAYSFLNLTPLIMEDSLIFDKDTVFAVVGYPQEKYCEDRVPILKWTKKLHFGKPYNMIPDSISKEISIKRIQYSDASGGDKLFSIPSIYEINAYFPQELAKSAIGQNIVFLTPLQNAINASVIANGGVFYFPSMVKKVEFGGKTVNGESKSERICKKYIAQRIAGMMNRVPVEGTARGAFFKFPFKNNVYCKTGTAESGMEKDISWLVGYFISPITGKKYIFCATFPDTGEGSRYAAPCVKRVFERLVLLEMNMKNK